MIEGANSKVRVTPVIKYEQFKKLFDNDDNDKNSSSDDKAKNTALTPKDLSDFLNTYYEVHPLQKLLSALETLNNFDETMNSSYFWTKFDKVKITNLGNFEGYSKYPNLINFVDASPVDFVFAITYLKSLPKSQRSKMFTLLFGQQFQEKLRQWNIWSGRDNRFYSPYFAILYNLRGIAATSDKAHLFVNSNLEKGVFEAEDDKIIKKTLTFENLAKYEKEKVGLPIFNFASISKETALSLFGVNSSKIDMDVFEEVLNDNLDSLSPEKNYDFLAKFLPFSKGTKFYVKLLKVANTSTGRNNKKVTLTLNFDIKVNGEFIASTAPIDVDLQIKDTASWNGKPEIVSKYYDSFLNNNSDTNHLSQNTDVTNPGSSNDESNNKKEGE